MKPHHFHLTLAAAFAACAIGFLVVEGYAPAALFAAGTVVAIAQWKAVKVGVAE